MAVAIVVLSMPGQARAEVTPHASMLRYPDVSQTHIVFLYANNLWLVPREGGTASPLTSADGQELFPRFSPDNQMLAFSADYGMGRDLYTMPVAGGVPQRKTHHPATEILCDWTPDGKLLISTNGFSGLARIQQLYTVSDASPLPQKMPVAYGSNGAISSDGKWLAFTPYSRDTRTWKRYRGGMASDIWLFHLTKKTAQRITDWEGTDSLPMWHGQSVYYLSDAGKEHRLNIWAYDTATGARRQITKFSRYDVKWPSIGPGDQGQGEIVFQCAADLYLLDLKSGDSRIVEVTIPGDRPQIMPQSMNAAKNLAGGDIAPAGQRVVLEARGDLWSVPVKNGSPRNMTRTSGVAERNPSWSPNGKWIAYFADLTGEYELYIKQSDGKGETRRLTEDGHAYRFSPTWSWDSKQIVFTDKTGSIYLHTIDSGKTTKIDQEPRAGRATISWSHDSSWIAYAKSKNDKAGIFSIWLYEVKTGKRHQVTDDMFSDTAPTFDRKGEYLYFASSRHFGSPMYEDIGTTFIYGKTEILIAMPLRKDVKNPLLPKSDEVPIVEKKEENKTPAQAKPAAKEPAAKEPTKEKPKDASADKKKSPEKQEKPKQLLSLEDPQEKPPKKGEPEKKEKPAKKKEAAKKKAAPKQDDKKEPVDKKPAAKDKKANDKNPKSADAKGNDAKGNDAKGKGLNGKDAKKEAAKPATKTPAKPKSLQIDLEGIELRAFRIPVKNGIFSNLCVSARGQLIYARRGVRGTDEKPAIKVVDMSSGTAKEATILEGPTQFTLSANGKKLLVMIGSTMMTMEAAPGQKPAPISTSGMTVMVDPRAQWKQLFMDAWRVERDFFYDPNMHGVHWLNIRQQYAKMLADCTSREDVGFVISEMISELNVGHSYYRPPRGTSTPRTKMGLLGCEFACQDGAYQIAKFYEGAVWDFDARNPLRQAGVNEGDFLLAINRMPLDTDRSPWSELQGLGGKTVVLTVSKKPKSGKEDRDVVVKLLSSDSNLRYRQWVEHNRKYVEKKSGGKIGYIYVPDTGTNGQNNLFRQFFGQASKSALIIDDRWNGGGQIPTRFIELLNRPVTNYWAKRDGIDMTWPPDAHHGPKCMLINGLAGSGGDMFPALFRQAGLGKLIGMRTWGGLVGISSNPSMVDGSSVTAPSFAYYEKNGTWGIEGHGVDPDIEVVDDPAKLAQGIDPQLDAAIQLMLEEIERHPYTAPKRPAYPDRSGIGIKPEDK